jgi:hypothetical protein
MLHLNLDYSSIFISPEFPGADAVMQVLIGEIFLGCEFFTFFEFFPIEKAPNTFFSFWYPNTVSSYSEKGLWDDTFLKPFFCALLSEKNAFGPPKASKMSERFLEFQTRHNFSLHPVLQFLLRVSLATFSTDQLKSAQTVSELLPRACTSKCTQKHHTTTNFFRVKNFKKID